jgi:hypothetical protein
MKYMNKVELLAKRESEKGHRAFSLFAFFPFRLFPLFT